ncbi:MAG TPA: 23S rRNA (guanosine(2251)-2'-O)-methyltransferase RlmB [Ignavibacteriaceae bacterium]|nr:23S rRNA (guanosine(2251)-2'-O)-methyltransferase RlmB [Ignavibacteriaceae bacterium]
MSFVVGRKPVLEALKSGKPVDKIYLLFGQKGESLEQIRILAKRKKINVTQLSSDRFFSITKDKNTQGVVAVIPSFKYYELDELLNSFSEKQNPLLLLVESIQDVHNLGALLRTAECAGVDGVVITRHNTAPVNEVVVKASAGAVSYLKICFVNNIANTIDYLKKQNYWIIGSSLEEAKNYTVPDYNIPAALIIGNEEKGIRKLTAEKCDMLVKIPMKGKIQSLNVSVATGVLLFEILRKRSLS